MRFVITKSNQTQTFDENQLIFIFIYIQFLCNGNIHPKQKKIYGTFKPQIVDMMIKWLRKNQVSFVMKKNVQFETFIEIDIEDLSTDKYELMKSIETKQLDRNILNCNQDDMKEIIKYFLYATCITIDSKFNLICKLNHLTVLYEFIKCLGQMFVCPTSIQYDVNLESYFIELPLVKQLQACVPFCNHFAENNIKIKEEENQIILEH